MQAYTPTVPQLAISVLGPDNAVVVRCSLLFLFLLPLRNLNLWHETYHLYIFSQQPIKEHIFALGTDNAIVVKCSLLFLFLLLLRDLNLWHETYHLYFF
jgi:hypothetical protein